jgi:hypothetical protein
LEGTPNFDEKDMAAVIYRGRTYKVVRNVTMERMVCRAHSCNNPIVPGQRFIKIAVRTFHPKCVIEEYPAAEEIYAWQTKDKSKDK